MKSNFVVQTNFKRILVPMDGSKPSLNGLDNAIEIARACQGSILGIYVISFVPTEFMPTVVPYRIHQKKDAGIFLEKAKVRAAKRGILFKYVIVYGSPAEEILRIARSKKMDLIVVGARGKGRASEIFLGSVSNAILHKSSTPVLIVK